jgi:2-polyprenyl-3-methyl-5-hydroxy-6-metoxy-1,4-benzoquinol methylase
MIDTSIFLEKFLQNLRFKEAKKYLKGDVLDFGGNEGELKKFVSGKYMVVNYDHSIMENKNFDTIVALAVIEHIPVREVLLIFKKFRLVLKPGGHVFLATPTVFAKPILEFLAFFGFVDKENIREHKHYWTKKELFDLAKDSGFQVQKYKKFQLGFNQFAVLK